MLSFDYSSKYESPLIHGNDTPRPWNLMNEISSRLDLNKTILDIGCGTAFKLLPLAPKCRYFIGLEPNFSMQKKAVQNASDVCAHNFFLVGGYSQQLPFSDATFDVVTVILLSQYCINEIHRVLRPQGWAIIEAIGERDKHDLKIIFGKDQKGWRGQYTGLEVDAILKKNKEGFSRLFSEVTVINGLWKTYYSYEGLELLLKETPTLRNFGARLDKAALKSFCDKHSTEKGIEVEQHRVLILAKK